MRFPTNKKVKFGEKHRQVKNTKRGNKCERGKTKKNDLYSVELLEIKPAK